MASSEKDDLFQGLNFLVSLLRFAPGQGGWSLFLSVMMDYKFIDCLN